MPKPFSPIPMPKRSGEPDPEEDNEEGVEDGMTKSVDYICGLIDKEVDGGIPVEKIVVKGFSQGCAISLLIGLMSRYKGKLAGAVGLSGYVPLNEKMGKAIKKRKEGDTATTKWFIPHGSRDQLVGRVSAWRHTCTRAWHILQQGQRSGTCVPGSKASSQSAESKDQPAIDADMRKKTTKYTSSTTQAVKIVGNHYVERL
jgi:hypothetical protein